MLKTYFSNRIPKHSIDSATVQSMTNTLFVFNQGKHFAYQTQIREVRNQSSRREASMHLTVKDKYGLNDYYANSAIRETQALISAQNELNNFT